TAGTTAAAASANFSSQTIKVRSRCAESSVASRESTVARSQVSHPCRHIPQMRPAQSQRQSRNHNGEHISTIGNLAIWELKIGNWKLEIRQRHITQSGKIPARRAEECSPGRKPWGSCSEVESRRDERNT